MHIVLAVLSAVGGLIWALVALQQSGFDPASLNPFLWYRRAQWRRKYGTHPLFTLDDPLDVAAVLVLGTAKCEGEISSEQKRLVLDLYQTEFHLDADAAADLLLASNHLIRDQVYLVDNLGKLLERSSRRFTRAQVTSMLAMMTRIATFESAINEEQRKLIAGTERYFEQRLASTGRWQTGSPA